MVKAGPATGIRVKASFFPHAFYLFPPKVDIDGAKHELSWGSHFIPLNPGKHSVRLYTQYAMQPEKISLSLDVVVEEGRTLELVFSMAPWSTGSLRAV